VEIPILTHDTATLDMVLPWMPRIHTIPIPMKPVYNILQFYPHLCYTLNPLNLDPSFVLLVVSKCLQLLFQELNKLLVAMKILEEHIVMLPPYRLNGNWLPNI